MFCLFAFNFTIPRAVLSAAAAGGQQAPCSSRGRAPSTRGRLLRALGPEESRAGLGRAVPAAPSEQLSSGPLPAARQGGLERQARLSTVKCGRLPAAGQGLPLARDEARQLQGSGHPAEFVGYRSRCGGLLPAREVRRCCSTGGLELQV